MNEGQSPEASNGAPRVPLGEQTDNGVAPLTKPAETVRIGDPENERLIGAAASGRVSGIETTPAGDPDQQIEPPVFPAHVQEKAQSLRDEIIAKTGGGGRDPEADDEEPEE